jgi:DNA-binding transcriptional LysR family regulator
MDLRDLEVLVAVAEAGNFGRAADRLHLAQPPVSRRIQRLERELGLVLFERDRRGARATDAGRALTVEARRVLAQAARVEAAARAWREGGAGRIRLGFVASAAAEVLPRLVQAHRRRAPAVEWRVQARVSREQAEALGAGDLDAGLLRPPARHAGIAVVPIRRERPAALVPRAHPLGGRSRLTLADLAGWPLIVYPREDGPEVHDRIIGACREAGFEPVVAQTCGEFAAAAGLVAAGLGVALVIGRTYAGLPADVRLVPVDHPGLDWTLALAWDARTPPPAVLRLAETARRLWPEPEEDDDAAAAVDADARN